MRSREFNQEWKYGLEGFGDYCNSMCRNLNAIQKNYGRFFDTNSQVSIKKYIEKFEVIFNDILNICIKEDEIPTSYDENWYNYNRYNFTHRQLKEDVLEDAYGFNVKISDNYYYDLLPLVNKIFNIEDRCSHIVKQIWRRTLTDVNDFEEGKPYRLLVKILADWRTSVNTREKIDYMDSRIGCSTSLITDKKSTFFKSEVSGFGLVYNLNGGLLSAYCEDAFLTENIEGNCPLFDDGDDLVKLGINRIHKSGRNEVYSERATKIGTPASIIQKHSDCFNEVIIDLEKAESTAVFYIQNKDVRRPDVLLDDLYNQDYFKARQLAKKLNLPIIALKQFNNYFSESKSEKINDTKNLIEA
jgi:hypothetical protein